MSRVSPRTPFRRTELRQAVRSLWPAIAGIAAASAMINILMLTGPLFMLQVYDRVLTSRSGATLVGLCVMALVLFLFQGAFEALRSRILARTGLAFDARVAPRAFEVLARSEPAAGRDGMQVIRDLDSVRGFISGPGLAALFDLPWMPLYVGVCFLFHPWLGVAVLCGAVMLCAITLVGDRLTRRPSAELTPLAARRRDLADATRRNAVLSGALGMRGRLADMWAGRNEAFLDKQTEVADISNSLNSLTRTLRTALQSGVLALGAWLVINQEATGGVMLAATILTVRAVSPVEVVIGHWKSLVGARQAWGRLETELEASPPAADRTPLPAPRRDVALASVGLAPPEGKNLIVSDITLRIEAGSALGVVGASGSGKSSLGRALVGAWPTTRGMIRLDGATFDQFAPDAIGAFVGYLPQDVELFAGTVAQNISRFCAEPDPQALLAAARSAGVHDLILRLPDGYDTEVGEGGVLLSGGQRQRIGLARALYGAPFLVVLDEPNSNLDAQGEQALTQAIVEVRRRGGVVVVIAHRPSALSAVDQLLVLNDGRMLHHGPRDEVLARLGAATLAPVGPKPADAKPANAKPTNAKPADTKSAASRLTPPQARERTSDAPR